MTATKHGKSRMKQRIGSNTALQQAKNAWRKGYTRYDVCDDAVRFMDALSARYRCTIRIYKHKVWAFNSHNKHVITVFELPDKYKEMIEYDTAKD